MKQLIRSVAMMVFLCPVMSVGFAQISYHSITKKQLDSIFPGINLSKQGMITVRNKVKFLQHDNSIPPQGDTVPYKKVYKKGTYISVNYTIKDGKTQTAKKFRFWTLELEVPEATELGVVLSNISLDSHSEIYMLNSDRNLLAGPVTKSKFNWRKTPQIRLMLQTIGKVLLIVKSPISDKEPVHFDITSLYADNTATGGNGGGMQLMSFTGCMPYIKCFPAKTDISRAVAKVYIPIIGGGGDKLGTGTLISNELNNGRAFFVTAKHVLDQDDDGIVSGAEVSILSLAQFHFRFWNSDCLGNFPEPGIIFSGATLLVQSYSNDMILLELTNPPGIGDDVTYAGWNRQGGLPLENGSFVAHHPEGERMRGAWTRNVNHYLWDNSRWSVFYQYGDQGASTAPGSSGSALLNEYDQVVGTLYQGLVNCGNQSLGDQYEKFGYFWNAGMGIYLSPSYALESVPKLVTHELPITGDEYIPCSGTVQFSVPNFVGCTFTWNHSSNIQITSGAGTSTVHVQRTNSSLETAWISVLITDSKGDVRSKTITKYLKMVPDQIGHFNTCMTRDPVTLLDYNTVCSGLTRVMMQYPPTSWSLVAGSPISWSVVGTNNELRFTLNPNDYAVFELTTTNGCQVFSRPYVFEATQQMFLRSYQVFPNPANAEITIEQSVDNKKSGIKSEIREIIVQTLEGRAQLQKKFANGNFKAVLNVSALPKNNYLIRIFDGKSWHTDKLIINR